MINGVRWFVVVRAQPRHERPSRGRNNTSPFRVCYSSAIPSDRVGRKLLALVKAYLARFVVEVICRAIV